MQVMHDIYAWVICIEAISNTSNWMFHIYAGNAWHLRWVICIEARPCASLSFALTFPCWHPTFRRPKIWFIMFQNVEDSHSGDWKKLYIHGLQNCKRDEPSHSRIFFYLWWHFQDIYQWILHSLILHSLENFVGVGVDDDFVNFKKNDGILLFLRS